MGCSGWAELEKKQTLVRKITSQHGGCRVTCNQVNQPRCMQVMEDRLCRGQQATNLENNSKLR